RGGTPGGDRRGGPDGCVHHAGREHRSRRAGHRPAGAGPAAAVLRRSVDVPGRPLPGAAAGSGVAADTDAVPDASRISPPVLLPGFPNPVWLTLSADIDPAGLELAGIRCRLHAGA